MNIHIFDTPTTRRRPERHVAALAPADPCAAPAGAMPVAQTPLAEIFAVGSGRRAALAIAQAVQADNATLADFFGTNPNDLHFIIYVMPGIGGAYHCGCDNRTLFVDANAQLSASFNAAEMVEVYEAIINNGWDCLHTNGEALSRALAVELHPELGPVLAPTEVRWFNNGADDYISINIATDRNEDANGCGTLFLYYLRYGLQPQPAWADIVQVGGATLSETYGRLTNRPANDAYPTFLQALNQFVQNQVLVLPVNGNPWAP